MGRQLCKEIPKDIIIEIRKATLADMRGLAPRLREEDRSECLAATGLPPELLLPLSLSKDEVWVFVINGTPEAVLGLSPVDRHPYFGLVWMLATPEIFNQRRALLRLTPEVLDMLHSRYPLLGNHVDMRNVTHVRWLKRLGFSFLRVHKEFGVSRTPFIEFARLRPKPCA